MFIFLKSHENTMALCVYVCQTNRTTRIHLYVSEHNKMYCVIMEACKYYKMQPIIWRPSKSKYLRTRNINYKPHSKYKILYFN